MLALALVLAGALVAYSSLTNRAPSGEVAYLVRNLVTGVVLVGLALAAGLSPEQLGLSPAAAAAGLSWGRVVVVAVAVVAAAAGALADRVPAIGRALDDERADLPLDRLVFHVLVRIPLGTALFEEVAFRGVLLAAFDAAAGTGWAVAASSVAFGLWHVGPTRLAARENGVDDPGEVRRRVAVAVVVTTVGGVGFALLRVASGSLLAPVLAHWATNALFLLVAAARRSVAGRHA